MRVIRPEVVELKNRYIFQVNVIFSPAENIFLFCCLFTCFLVKFILK